jgi:hypothetical protein
VSAVALGLAAAAVAWAVWRARTRRRAPAIGALQ